MSQVPRTNADFPGGPVVNFSAEEAHPQAQALVALSAQVLPVWARQLASSRSQSEAAVTEMLAAFAEIGPHLDLASRQSRQISAALAQGQDGITQLAQACDGVLQPVLGGCSPEAQAAITKVLTMIHATVDAVEEIAKPFEHETHMVSLQVERMYKGFQYQDRISQMMTLLHEDIERLQSAMQTPSVAVNPSEWLTRLESQYVMTEQRQQHTQGPVADATDDDETTFF
jgi:soluble cytochrome b562